VSTIGGAARVRAKGLADVRILVSRDVGIVARAAKIEEGIDRDGATLGVKVASDEPPDVLGE
jgi:hypothetical protein